MSTFVRPFLIFSLVLLILQFYTREIKLSWISLEPYVVTVKDRITNNMHHIARKKQEAIVSDFHHDNDAWKMNSNQFDSITPFSSNLGSISDETSVTRLLFAAKTVKYEGCVQTTVKPKSGSSEVKKPSQNLSRSIFNQRGHRRFESSFWDPSVWRSA